MEETKQRQVAHVISVEEINKGTYIKSEGWNPSYVKVGNREVSRANLIGVIISSQEDVGLVKGAFDDGTGIIDLLFFEQTANQPIGQIVNLIGKVREYNGKKAITPEIVKPLSNPKWVELRKLQLSMAPKEIIIEAPPTQEKEPEVEEVEIKPKKEENAFDKVSELIKKLDTGEGTDHQAIIEELGEDGEKIIEHLLREGEIFEISPGKLKILD